MDCAVSRWLWIGARQQTRREARARLAAFRLEPLGRWNMSILCLADNPPFRLWAASLRLASPHCPVAPVAGVAITAVRCRSRR